MKKGAVIVDVAIDQGGCIETAHPTTHSDPSYVGHGVVHYCVTNMPAAVPNTSTLALTNATFPYVLKLASMGADAAIRQDKGIAEGVNTYNGSLTYKPSPRVSAVTGSRSAKSPSPEIIPRIPGTIPAPPAALRVIPIIAHGFQDSTDLLLIYAGNYPGLHH